jgi:anti-anti-sigma factor
MNFKVSTSPIDRNGVLISVEGDFDLSTADQVRRSAEQAISARRPMILDLYKCAFMDSTALRLVLQVHRDLSEGAGSSPPLAVVVSPALRKFFSMTAIDQSVPVFLNHEQALDSLGAIQSHINTSPGAEPEPLGHPSAIASNEAA